MLSDENGSSGSGSSDSGVVGGVATGVDYMEGQGPVLDDMKTAAKISKVNSKKSLQREQIDQAVNYNSQPHR